MTTDATAALDAEGVDVLDRRECLRLLHTAVLGRVGFSRGALPMVLPSSYVMDGDSIVLRPTAGLWSPLEDAVVAFEVDELDAVSGRGWWVTVIGVARACGPDALTIAPEIVAGHCHRRHDP